MNTTELTHDEKFHAVHAWILSEVINTGGISIRRLIRLIEHKTYSCEDFGFYDWTGSSLQEFIDKMKQHTCNNISVIALNTTGSLDSWDDLVEPTSNSEYFYGISLDLSGNAGKLLGLT